MYNSKGEPIFDAAEGPRNELYYNAFGNILIACGFGNIAKGKMEFWDVDTKKEIISVSCAATNVFFCRLMYLILRNLNGHLMDSISLPLPQHRG